MFLHAKDGVFSSLSWSNLWRSGLFGVVRYSILTYVSFSQTFPHKVAHKVHVFLQSSLVFTHNSTISVLKVVSCRKTPLKMVFCVCADFKTLRDLDRLWRLSVLSCSTTWDLSISWWASLSDWTARRYNRRRRKTPLKTKTVGARQRMFGCLIQSRIGDAIPSNLRNKSCRSTTVGPIF